MDYPQIAENLFCSRDQNSPASKMKLSELDKVALNMMYFPYTSERYNPILSMKTGMHHCKRPNQIQVELTGGRTDDKCDESHGATCAACRTFKTPKVDALRKNSKWIGQSGMVYCGKSECNIDKGLNCDSCFEF